MVRAPEFPDEKVSTAQAAELLGVSTATIRGWVLRGYLTKIGLDIHGRALYRWIDVARAERATRDRARRKFAVAAQEDSAVA